VEAGEAEGAGAGEGAADNFFDFRRDEENVTCLEEIALDPSAEAPVRAEAWETAE